MPKKHKNTEPQLVGLISDTHIGHKLGLLNPASTLKDENQKGLIVEKQMVLSEPQKYLWNIQQSAVERAEAFDGRFGLIHAGDLCQGNKRSTELLSTRISDQVLLARDAMQPWFRLKRLAWVRFTKGTGAHEFEEGAAAIMLLFRG